MSWPARKPALTALLVLAAMALLAIGADLWRGARAPASAAAETIVIATNTEYMGACSVLAAQDQRYFAAHGLAVRVLPFVSGKEALNAVLEGRADIATAADIAVMFAAMDRAPIQVLSTIFRTEHDHGLVARRDRGIEKPADLKGKRIGLTLSTSGHFTLDVYLNRQRLAAQDVQLVNYPPDRLQAAIVSGEVDAVSTWEPHLDAIAARLGANAQRFSGAEVYDSIYNLIAQSRYVRLHPDTVQHLLRALDDGSRYCQSHPAEASAFLHALAPERRAALLQSWRSQHFGLELDQGLLLALEDQARWAVKARLSARQDIPNFLDYIYMDGLSAIRPYDVSIIH